MTYRRSEHYTTIIIKELMKGRKVGGTFKREATHVHLWLIQVDGRQKPTQQDKAIILGLKLSTFKIEKRTNENVLTFPYLISKATKFRKSFIQDPVFFFFLGGGNKG